MLTGLCFAAMAGMAQQNVTILPMPSSGYVLDKAGMLSAEDIRVINGISDGAKQQAQAPIVVVTVPSLASIGAHDADWYATTLFNAWAIGDRRTNKGVLLFVARDDRKARIELGAGWGYTKDSDCQKIMDGWIIPEFKKGNFSGGIRNGVTALDSMVRLGKVPRPPIPAWAPFALLGGGSFLFMMIISFIRDRMEGWAGRMMRGIGNGISNIHFESGSSDSGSSWGGSDFSGGGSSGGGGASGSW